MNWEKILGIVCSVVAIVAGGVAIYEHFSTDETTPAQESTSKADPVIVLLARTTFNDSGFSYAEGFDGEIIRLNGSMQVVYLV